VIPGDVRDGFQPAPSIVGHSVVVGMTRILRSRVTGPVAGFVVTYVFFLLTPWGRALDSLAYHGRVGTGWAARSAEAKLLETISTTSLALALVVLVLLAGLRGRWRLGLRCGAAVVGAVVSTEVLKHLLPGVNHWSGQWRWLSTGSFPSGHAVIVVSVATALLAITAGRGRRLVAGPLVAWTAVATTATVTLGWHRPSDVLGSLFLATAWHRATTAPQRPASRLAAIRSVPGSALLWWAFAGVLVLGAALEGVLSGPTLGDVAPLAYLTALVVLLVAVGITLAASTSSTSTRAAGGWADSSASRYGRAAVSR
jgi:membrane-associated phospholipid phosphatase